MVDHPLVANDIRSYINTNKLEETLNHCLNKVLETLPHEPISKFYAHLIEVMQYC